MRILPNHKEFRRIIWQHYHASGRDLPWRNTNDPYCILVSEFMLQQTQVTRVETKYKDFLKRFPTFTSLTTAPLREVLQVWQGLGYNRRALALKRTAEIVVNEYSGKLPRDPEELRKLPGIGPGTAGAIAAFAFNLPVAFIETNIRRVFIHFFFPQNKKVRDSEILKLAERAMDRKNPREWHWALMDYGAMLGKTMPNPNLRSVTYRKQPPFKGSDRELRGEIVRLLSNGRSFAPATIAKRTDESLARVRRIIMTLEKEGFIINHKERIQITS